MGKLVPIAPLGGLEPQIDRVGGVVISEVTDRALASVSKIRKALSMRVSSKIIRTGWRIPQTTNSPFFSRQCFIPRTITASALESTKLTSVRSRMISRVCAASISSISCCTWGT